MTGIVPKAYVNLKLAPLDEKNLPGKRQSGKQGSSTSLAGGLSRNGSNVAGELSRNGSNLAGGLSRNGSNFAERMSNGSLWSGGQNGEPTRTSKPVELFARPNEFGGPLACVTDDDESRSVGSLKPHESHAAVFKGAKPVSSSSSSYSSISDHGDEAAGPGDRVSDHVVAGVAVGVDVHRASPFKGRGSVESVSSSFSSVSEHGGGNEAVMGAGHRESDAHIVGGAGRARAAAVVPDHGKAVNPGVRKSCDSDAPLLDGAAKARAVAAAAAAAAAQAEAQVRAAVAAAAAAQAEAERLQAEASEAAAFEEQFGFRLNRKELDSDLRVDSF